jgi:citrate synthase
LHDAPPDPATARALEAYLMACAEHGLNASTFAARVIVATRSDLASTIVGAIGALKGPLHGGAPAEVLGQLDEIGSVDHAEAWARDRLSKRELIMGFGHRVYRAYDPRAAALRVVAEQLPQRPPWLDLAIGAEEIILRVFAEMKPNRVIKTNVEFYAAAVLQGVGLSPDLFPATFGIARMAGWSAHAIEQAAVDKIIRPEARYVGPPARHLPSA